MSYSENCRECGIEIEPDITNPEGLCEECEKERHGKKNNTFGGVF